MKFLNKNQIWLSFITLFLLIFSFFIPIRTQAEVVPDTTPPIVTIDNIKIVDGITMINGHVSDDQTPDNQILLEFYDTSDQLVDTIVPLADGTWSYEKTLTLKPNSLYIKAMDTAANSKTFPVDDQRPHIKALTIPVFLSKDKTTQVENTKLVDLLKNEDMTRISLNPTVTITLEDNDVIDNQTFTNPITVFSKTGTVSGTVSVNEQKQIVVSIQNLAPSTTYYIIANSSLTDDAGNSVYPVIKKFTTVSGTLYDADYTTYTADWNKLPHGYYTNNVNTCINCHNTHVSVNSGLDNPTSSYRPKDQSLMDSYCMACHDGTTAAPMPDNFGSDIVSKHDTQTTDHPSNAGSCTSCHNPHLTWNTVNPNFLKDHYVYQHKTEDMKDGEKVGEVDSRTQLCEKCHDITTNYYKNMASDLVKQQNDPDNPDAYHVMHYQKLSATGKAANFDLCFSCHNGQKELMDGTKDIQKYYNDPNSKHLIAAMDGSMLNGNIPCAECHQTHGSKNLFLLKGKLGHENESDFSFTTGNWDSSMERDFCLKCHNESTAIYGVVGDALDPTKSTGHAETSTEACSNCHGGASKSFMEAAHAPKLPAPTP